MGCHGAWHGAPYTVTIATGTARIGIDGLPVPESPAALLERRDAEWVARRIGRYIELRRRDVIEYVFEKLGVDPGAAFLARHYYLEVFPA